MGTYHNTTAGTTTIHTIAAGGGGGMIVAGGGGAASNIVYGGGGGPQVQFDFTVNVATMSPALRDNAAYGQLADRGPTIRPGKVFVADMEVDKTLFHYLVWLRTAGEGVEYGIFTSYEFLKNNRPPAYLCFYKEADYDAFNAWLDRYKARYTESLREVCVPGPIAGKISGEMVKRCHKCENVPDEIAVWAWLTENCGAVRYVGEHLLFENSSDAVAYKMRWCDK